MITITRLLARQLRALLRRTFMLSSRGGGPPVVLETGPRGLTIRAQTELAALEYHEPGVLSPEQMAVPYMLLVDCEGTKGTPVTIEKSGDDRLACQFLEKQVPVLYSYDLLPLPEKPFPSRPANLIAQEPSLLTALHNAMETTDVESVRYAVNCIQLRGASGEIAATDGRHVLLQAGCQFPWTDDLLVPRTTAFGAKELPTDSPVQVGCSDDWVSFCVDRWTIHLAIQKCVRFPKVESVLRRPDLAVTKLQVSAGDATFLLSNLKHLPRDEFESAKPVTLDLNGSIAIRACPPDQPHPLELVLHNSRYTGEPIRLNTDREYLERALRLGFSELCIFDQTSPLQCGDERRTYAWMLLNPDGIVPADEHAMRIESPADNGSPSTPTVNRISRSMAKRKPTPAAQATEEPTNGHVPAKTALASALPEVAISSEVAEPAEPRERASSAIQRAIELRDSLRGVLSQTNELVAALKREKKQARLVATTLASLKQLQTVS